MSEGSSPEPGRYERPSVPEERHSGRVWTHTRHRPSLLPTVLFVAAVVVLIVIGVFLESRLP